MARVLNLVVAGVGGQGLITLSTIIAKAALIRGFNAVVAETHGLSQRGGTVTVHVRLGSAEAPLVPAGAADALLAMELIEAARHIHYLAPGGAAVVNRYLVPPPLPGVEPPGEEKLLREIAARTSRLVLVPATREALRLGDSRVANMVLLGAAIEAGALRDMVDMESVERAIAATWPRAAERNIEALHRGAELARQAATPPA